MGLEERNYPEWRWVREADLFHTNGHIRRISLSCFTGALVQRFYKRSQTWEIWALKLTRKHTWSGNPSTSAATPAGFVSHLPGLRWKVPEYPVKPVCHNSARGWYLLTCKPANLHFTNASFKCIFCDWGAQREWIGPGTCRHGSLVWFLHHKTAGGKSLSKPVRNDQNSGWQQLWISVSRQCCKVLQGPLPLLGWPTARWKTQIVDDKRALFHH